MVDLTNFPGPRENVSGELDDDMLPYLKRCSDCGRRTYDDGVIDCPECGANLVWNLNGEEVGACGDLCDNPEVCPGAGFCAVHLDREDAPVTEQQHEAAVMALMEGESQPTLDEIGGGCGSADRHDYHWADGVEPGFGHAP